MEIGALQFVNTGKTSCDLGGYPGVELLHKGSSVGKTSVPVPGSHSVTRTLKPNQYVQSIMRDFSTCNAPLSDTARITIPGESSTVERPAVFRACAIQVTSLGKPRE